MGRLKHETDTSQTKSKLCLCIKKQKNWNIMTATKHNRSAKFQKIGVSHQSINVRISTIKPFCENSFSESLAAAPTIRLFNHYSFKQERLDRIKLKLFLHTLTSLLSSLERIYENNIISHPTSRYDSSSFKQSFNKPLRNNHSQLHSDFRVFFYVCSCCIMIGLLRCKV